MENIFSSYTIKDLQTKETIRLKDNIDSKELKYFKYINNDATIYIEPPKYLNNDESLYFNNLKNIFDIINLHNKHYNICINIENFELFKQSNLLNYKNISLIIINDFYRYTKEEFLKDNEILEKIIIPIKESNLSPYEKYLAVYNIVKQFKPYKANHEDSKKSRNLHYILHNEYIVCVGFSTLLTSLLDKINIPSMIITTDIDTSYDDGFTIENITVNNDGHARNLIKLDDDKYNIHGIYIADPTWDNDMEYDLYNNSTITFNRKKEAKRLEFLTYEDLFLDFNSINDFNKKINFHLQQQINESYYDTFQKNLFMGYKTAYNNIMDILLKLDYPKYKQLHNKYNNQIIKLKILIDQNLISTKEIDQIFSNFLNEYMEYILPLSNQEIANNTLFRAASVVKSTINKYNETELKEWLETTKKVNETISSEYFPYSYNQFEPRQNYLITKKR